MKANSDEKIILAFGWNNWQAHIWGSGGGKQQSSGGREMVPTRLSNLWGSLSQVVSVLRQRGGPDNKVLIYNKFLQCRFRLGKGLGKWNTLPTYKGTVDKWTHTAQELQTVVFLMPKAQRETGPKQSEERRVRKKGKLKLCRPKTLNTAESMFGHNY